MSIASTFQNLSVRAKVLGAFTLVLAITTMLGVLAVVRLSEVNAHAEEIKTNWLPSVRYLGDLKFNMTAVDREQAQFLLETTDAGRAGWRTLTWP